MTAAADEAPAAGQLRRVVVVGSGLLGTSIGLALRARGVEVLLDDRNKASVSLAVDLGAGSPLAGDDTADHAVLCVPPGAVADVLRTAQKRQLAGSYSDVASVKVVPLAAAARAGCDLSSYVGGHPMAGRERAGAVAARADLFRGRPWVLTSDERTSEHAVAAAEAVALVCGASPVRMSAQAHDAAVAAVSHAPQVLASTLAATLTALPAEARALAGQGLRDTIRIAGSDPALWADIAACNAEPLAAVLERLSADLAVTARLLREGPDRAALHELFARGNAGRAALPGKHGGTGPRFASVSVVVPDEPGQLARLLADAAAAGVNVEDLSVEHSPGHPVGVVELAVRPEQSDVLLDGLAERSWPVHPGAGSGIA